MKEVVARGVGRWYLQSPSQYLRSGCLRVIWRNCALPKRMALRHLALLDPLVLIPAVVLTLHSAPEVEWVVESNLGWTLGWNVNSNASDRVVWFERLVLHLHLLIAPQVQRENLS